MTYSIIIPVYNVAGYLPRFAQSILPQLPFNATAIFIDDGSTDGSGEICDRFAKEYACVQVIHKENGGVASARNVGLSAADGDYILWADPDDCVSTDWFRSISAILEAEEPDMLHFDYLELENGMERARPYGRTPGLLDKDVYLRDVIRDFRVNSALWCRAFHRRLFEGMPFDENIRCLEDYALLHRLILRAHKIVYLPKVLYYYLIRSDGLIRTPNLEISFQCYLIALRRKEELRDLPAYDHLGIIIQAREFCRNYYLAGEPKEYEKAYRVCRDFLRREWRSCLLDREMPIKFKIKTLGASCATVGRINKRLKMKR